MTGMDFPTKELGVPDLEDIRYGYFWDGYRWDRAGSTGEVNGPSVEQHHANFVTRTFSVGGQPRSLAEFIEVTGFAFTRNSPKWLRGSNGIIRRIEDDELPYDYAANGTPLGLLMERQSANLVGNRWNFSLTPDGTEWNTTGITVPVESGPDPAGGNTGSIFSEVNTTTWHGRMLRANGGGGPIEGDLVVPDGDEITSCFARQIDSRRYVGLRSSGNSRGAGATVIFDLQTGEATGTILVRGSVQPHDVTYGSIGYPDGWWRFWIKHYLESNDPWPGLMLSEIPNPSSHTNTAPNFVGVNGMRTGAAWLQFQKNETDLNSPKPENRLRTNPWPADLIAMGDLSGYNIIVDADGFGEEVLEGQQVHGHLRSITLVPNA